MAQGFKKKEVSLNIKLITNRGCLTLAPDNVEVLWHSRCSPKQKYSVFIMSTFPHLQFRYTIKSCSFVAGIALVHFFIINLNHVGKG